MLSVNALKVKYKMIQGDIAAIIPFGYLSVITKYRAIKI